MNDQQIETLIPHPDKQMGRRLFGAARSVALFAGALTVAPIFLPSLTLFLLIFAVIAWIAFGSLWAEARETWSGVTNVCAYTVWEEVNRISRFGEHLTPGEHELFQHLESIYERDPHGQVLPLPQAIQLVLSWKQQQDRLQLLETHVAQMHTARAALLDNQKLLCELNDEDAALERSLARLNHDIVPLEQSCDALRASCIRLESLLREVDLTIQRRQLHSEVGKITSRLPSAKKTEPLALPTDYLDLEHQITREIETYLQLERETDAQMRDL